MTMLEPISEVPPLAERDQAGARRTAGRAERLLSTIGGSALVAYGLARRSVPGLVLALAGGALIQHGVSGHRGAARSPDDRTAPRAPLLRVGQRAGRLLGALAPAATRVARTVTVARPAADLYQFWRNFDNLPRFMEHLTDVEVIDGSRSRWTARAPGGGSVSWRAEIIEDRENELIAWRSREPADIENAGSVRFVPAPGGRGTEVHVTIDYKAPAGALGRAIAKVFGEEPDQQLRDDLRHFKQLMEAGEIPTIEGQPSGRRSAVMRG
ncbi:SRPBCC family protein [Sorangium sp. So ce1078]|uniref:SRPBCC family protein n=1 Tax=Sorangium sp. So ce1078 TaxID=3133329 RepID=UPI003F6379E6